MREAVPALTAQRLPRRSAAACGDRFGEFRNRGSAWVRQPWPRSGSDSTAPVPAARPRTRQRQPARWPRLRRARGQVRPSSRVGALGRRMPTWASDNVNARGTATRGSACSRETVRRRLSSSAWHVRTPASGRLHTLARPGRLDRPGMLTASRPGHGPGPALRIVTSWMTHGSKLVGWINLPVCQTVACGQKFLVLQEQVAHLGPRAAQPRLDRARAPRRSRRRSPGSPGLRRQTSTRAVRWSGGSWLIAAWIATASSWRIAYDPRGVRRRRSAASRTRDRPHPLRFRAGWWAAASAARSAS